MHAVSKSSKHNAPSRRPSSVKSLHTSSSSSTRPLSTFAPPKTYPKRYPSLRNLKTATTTPTRTPLTTPNRKPFSAPPLPSHPYSTPRTTISMHRRVTDTPNCWMIFQRGPKELGYVEFRLYDDWAVAAAENFRLLCKGSVICQDGAVMSYQGSNIFGIYPGNYICGGDTEFGVGHIGVTAFDNRPTRTDLSAQYYFRHDRAGLLSTGLHDHDISGDDVGYDETDVRVFNSKYQISLDECPWLNTWSEVFGEVVKGFNIVMEIANTPVDARDFPLQPVWVKACGVCNW